MCILTIVAGLEHTVLWHVLEYLLVQKKEDTAQDKRSSNQYPSNNDQAAKLSEKMNDIYAWLKEDHKQRHQLTRRQGIPAQRWITLIKSRITMLACAYRTTTNFEPVWGKN